MKLALIFFLTSVTLIGQNIKGIVLEMNTEKPLEYVNIYYEKEKKGAISDENGAFRLKLKSKLKSKDAIRFSMIGYKTKDFTLTQLKDLDFVIYLEKKIENLNEVSIISNKKLKSKLAFKKLNSLKKGLYGFGTTIINDRIYVIGGDESFFHDAARETFDEIASMPNATLKDFLRKSEMNHTWENYSDKLQIYDISTNKWTISDLKFRKRAYHKLVHLHDKLYVIGGKRLSVNKNREYLDDKIEVLDINNQTISVDDANPHQAVNFETFNYDNKIIVMGGSVKLNKNGKKVYTNKSHLYDLTSGYWYELKDIPNAKEVNGVIVNNTIYLIGGFDNNALTSVETYDPISGKWEKVAELFYGLENPAVTHHNNVIYLFEEGRMFTYDILSRVLNEYRIDLNLKGSELLFHNKKLYLVGGFFQGEYSITGSENLYSIDLIEFSNTKIRNTRNNKFLSHQ